MNNKIVTYSVQNSQNNKLEKKSVLIQWPWKDGQGHTTDQSLGAWWNACLLQPDSMGPYWLLGPESGAAELQWDMSRSCGEITDQVY